MTIQIGLKGVQTEEAAIAYAKTLLESTAIPEAEELSVLDARGREIAVVFRYSHTGNLGGTKPEVRVRRNPV